MTEDPRKIIDHEVIARVVATKTNRPVKDVSAVCDALIDAIADELKKGNTVRLSDFGTFSIPKKKRK